MALENEIGDLLIKLGSGATTAIAVQQAIKMYKNRKGDKADLIMKLDKALAEAVETNLNLRKELLDTRVQLSDCQKSK